MQRKYGHICVSVEIDKIWDLFDFSENNVKKLDPNITENKNTKLKSTVVGSTFNQKFELNGKCYSHDVKITHYQNNGNKRTIGVEYYYAKKYKVNRILTFEKMGEYETKITCVIERDPINFIQKIMFYFRKPQTVESYLNHVKNVIENS